MGDWACQNWTKRDGRNNQEEQEQEQEQEKKATYKTAAELAVKNRLVGMIYSRHSGESFVSTCYSWSLALCLRR
jgi:hypothetical protein